MLKNVDYMKISKSTIKDFGIIYDLVNYCFKSSDAIHKDKRLTPNELSYIYNTKNCDILTYFYQTDDDNLLKQNAQFFIEREGKKYILAATICVQLTNYCIYFDNKKTFKFDNHLNRYINKFYLSMIVVNPNFQNTGLGYDIVKDSILLCKLSKLLSMKSNSIINYDQEHKLYFQMENSNNILVSEYQNIIIEYFSSKYNFTKEKILKLSIFSSESKPLIEEADKVYIFYLKNSIKTMKFFNKFNFTNEISSENLSSSLYFLGKNLTEFGQEQKAIITERDLFIKSI